MTYSSSITKDPTPLVLDTSVLINLHACRCGERILSSLPNSILLPEIVVSELTHETSRRNGEHQFVQYLVANKIVEVAELDERGYEIFGDLVLGSPSLGDGEAATIATAARLKCLPVVDDQKGRNMSQPYLPDKGPAWSLDLICHPQVVAELGDRLFTEALFHALHDGRMRIREDRCDYIVSLIGPQRAIECPSLPGYKQRKLQWEERISLNTVGDETANFSES